MTCKVLTTIDGEPVILRPYRDETDGEFIRKCSRENFYEYINNSFGWNETLHQETPKFPEQYTFLSLKDALIGFYEYRVTGKELYIHTIQVLPERRNKGIGRKIIQLLEGIAASHRCGKISLRVLTGNPARGLYERLGYEVIEKGDRLLTMGKAITAQSENV